MAALARQQADHHDGMVRQRPGQRPAEGCRRGLGIIEARHGKGIFVKHLDPAVVFRMLSPLLKTQAEIDVKQIIEVRLRLEASIAELAAAHRTDDNLCRLDQPNRAGRLHTPHRGQGRSPPRPLHGRTRREVLGRGHVDPRQPATLKPGPFLVVRQDRRWSMSRTTNGPPAQSLSVCLFLESLIICHPLIASTWTDFGYVTPAT